MSIDFDEAYEGWMHSLLEKETNPRVLSRIENGLEHSTLEFLRSVWFPVMKNFNHLQPEIEVRDFHNGYRYLDLAYLPGNGVKGGIEIQGYGPHARDLDVRRFKDLCWRHCLLTLDNWIFLPIAYLSIKDEPKRCQQLVLSLWENSWPQMCPDPQLAGSRNCSLCQTHHPSFCPVGTCYASAYHRSARSKSSSQSD